MKNYDTIVAIATPPGRGGVGIIRVSGTRAFAIAEQVLGFIPPPRQACYANFREADGSVIDMGIVLRFIAPNSFTGEDIIEFQGHGGPVILDHLLQRILACGARMARAGEFSQRAFLNGKLDLAQAEAVADLINATSLQASRSALRSLQGVFSQQIENLQTQLTQLRIYVEAAIDFPEEEIDYLHDGKVASQLATLLQILATILQQARQGAILREGLTVVLAGYPNAGKSTLLNALAGKDLAIVTDIAGTTRDLLREHIQIDGIPLHIIDTAGLRDSHDSIEREGIRRAWQAISHADIVLLIMDIADLPQLDLLKQQLLQNRVQDVPVVIIVNKIDTQQQGPAVQHDRIYLSAKTGDGVELLRQHLKQLAGYDHEIAEDCFMARRRHIDVMIKTQQLLQDAQQQLIEHRAGELLAEDLRQAQLLLSEITGEFTADDLLGEIFASFCIGK